jgi:hypothetical protein
MPRDGPVDGPVPTIPASGRDSFDTSLRWCARSSRLGLGGLHACALLLIEGGGRARDVRKMKSSVGELAPTYIQNRATPPANSLTVEPECARGARTLRASFQCAVRMLAAAASAPQRKALHREFGWWTPSRSAAECSAQLSRLPRTVLENTLARPQVLCRSPLD